MRLEKFDSESIAAAGYDAAGAVLRLRFVDSGTYDYFDVPPQVWAGLRRAESKGRYFHDEIRDRYAYRLLT